MSSRMFAPKFTSVRMPTDNSRRNGAIINPPRLPEIGGMTKNNAEKREPDLTLRKPGGTRG